MSNTYQLVLIDGSNYLFHTYHAMPKLVSCKGQPTVATTAEPPDSPTALSGPGALSPRLISCTDKR